MKPEASAGPSLGETMARPIAPATDLGETMARPPQALGETLARDVTTVSGGGVSLQQTVRERLADFDTSVDDPIRIGRFTVLTMLGEGGMGVVYAAYDLELDRKVAIKLVRETATAGTQGHTSMLREAQAMARLSHPNVVQIYEVGEHDQQVFVAMEFVKGRTLTAWLTEAPRTWRDIRDMFVQAGHGLAAAHAEGLVHRDFKPDNVLIGADERARVADFGLAGVEARQRDVLSDSMRMSLSRLQRLDELLTVAGAVQGTPAYMAPEQHLGGETDARSDLFGFCVALWEALYGERPFPGDNLDDLADAVTRGQLRARPAVTAVPDWLHAALVGGLATLPEVRLATMNDLLALLTRDLREPVRSRAARWSIGLGLFAVVAATAVILATRERDPTAEELAAIAALAEEARGAGEAHHWVYPAPEAAANTSILHVVALEAMAGPAADPARDEAAALRREFSTALIGIGDRYWASEGGIPFARDFYVQGMIFDPTDQRARERSGLTPGQFAEVEAKALAGSFTINDIVAAEPLAILADADATIRRARLAAFQTRPDRGSAIQKTMIGELLGDPVVVGDDALDPASSPTQAAPGLDPAAADLLEEPLEPGLIGPEPPPVDSTVKPSKPRIIYVYREPGEAPRKPQSAAALARAEKLVADGEAARRRGELDVAEQRFHQALAEFSASVAALLGLCDVYFDRAQFEQAVGFAERAVVIDPEHPGARLRLGDTLVKLLRYNDARAHYEKAAELGHPQAAARLHKLKAKLGE